MRKQERGKRKEERGKRKEDRGQRTEERGKRMKEERRSNFGEIIAKKRDRPRPKLKLDY